MLRMYNLEMRVLLTQANDRVLAEVLECEGKIYASNREQALAALVRVFRLALTLGDPIYRDPPADLLERWKAAEEDGLATGDTEGLLLHLRGAFGTLEPDLTTNQVEARTHPESR